MIVGKVVGSVVATRKNEKLLGSKFMIVEPVSNMEKQGRIVAIDDVGAGIGETVLVATGSAARIGCSMGDAPVDAAIVGIVGSGVFVVTLLTVIIPVLHELTSALYCARQNVADYFEVQSKIVQFNAEQLKYNYTKSEAEIKKIYDKQIKIAELFKKISDKFAVKMSKAESDARKLIQKEKAEKFKAEDLETQDVPGMSSSIF
jgi:ethanolamine utilization protein EutN